MTKYSTNIQVERMAKNNPKIKVIITLDLEMSSLNSMSFVVLEM